MFRCAEAATEASKRSSGAIFNTASADGLGHGDSSLAYGATNSGVMNQTQNLAQAMASGVRVKAIEPGAVDRN